MTPPSPSKLYLFHAFGRPSPAQILDVLLNGPHHNPFVDGTCRTNEAHLNITPSAYAYAGRTVRAFGDNVLVVGLGDVVGLVSPFDTGGLVENIRPVLAWPPPDKQAFVLRYTFPTSDLQAIVALHPGATTQLVTDYLNDVLPQVDGPDKIWGGAPTQLWTAMNQWRAWFIEVRCAGRMDLSGVKLRAWSSTTHTFNAVRRLVESSTDPRADDLLRSWVRGGVSSLVDSLKQEQIP